MTEKLFIIPLLLSLALGYWATPLVIKFAWRFGLVDDPKKNIHPKKIHKYTVPRAGGLAIFIAIFISSLIFLPLDKHLIGILLGAITLTILGLLDDKFEINPYVRLLIQFFAAAMPIAAGIGVAFVTNPLTGGIINLSDPKIFFELLGQTRSIWILSDIFALFWIVALMNSLNISANGIEGQLPGVAAIAAITIGILSLTFSADIAEWPIITLAGITAGAFLGFLPYNVHPQRIMPAFSGAMLAGYMLGVLSILTTAKVGVLMVVLSVPIIDVGYTIVRRVASGKSPVWGDRGHLHHKLLDSGMSTKNIAYLYWGTTAVLGLLALSIRSTFKLYTIIGLTLFIGGLFLWLTHRHQK